MGLRAVKIDTLGLAKELENAGIPRPQAEAQIQTTIKVIDMAMEEKLATKHDITHALKHTEDKLLAEISKLQEADEKLSSKIEVIEEKLSNKILTADIKIDKLEEKLSTRMDKLEEKLSTKMEKLDEKLSIRMNKLDEKFSLEITGLKKDVQEVKDKTTQISSEMKQMSSTLTIKLGSILGGAMTLGFALLGFLIKFH